LWISSHHILLIKLPSLLLLRLLLASKSWLLLTLLLLRLLRGCRILIVHITLHSLWLRCLSLRSSLSWLCPLCSLLCSLQSLMLWSISWHHLSSLLVWIVVITYLISHIWVTTSIHHWIIHISLLLKMGISHTKQLLILTLIIISNHTIELWRWN